MPRSPDLQARIDAIRATAAPESDELTALRTKLAAREGRAGFKANVIEIKARIAELEGVDAE